ncbi:hypothetical protein [Amycolatopsis sp. NPDC051371]|uniref:hypothetical protein n=1 Tax=Amycolatopsis sp. NPDC051371 TaxID=3155800 RepID=UPI00342B8561
MAILDRFIRNYEQKWLNKPIPAPSSHFAKRLRVRPAGRIDPPPRLRIAFEYALATQILNRT